MLGYLQGSLLGLCEVQAWGPLVGQAGRPHVHLLGLLDVVPPDGRPGPTWRGDALL
jgi:hypothetical protein